MPAIFSLQLNIYTASLSQVISEQFLSGFIAYVARDDGRNRQTDNKNMAGKITRSIGKITCNSFMS